MNALRIEFTKLFRLANYLMLSLMILLPSAIVTIQLYSYHKQAGLIDSDVLDSLIKNVISIMNMILAIFIIINIGKEYSDSTLRKTIIDGYTRDEFFQGKLQLFLVVALSTFILLMLILLIGGLSIGQLSRVTDNLTISTIINPFIKILYTGAFAFFLIFLTRSVAVSIVIYYVWNTIELILTRLQQINESLNYHLERYLPLSSLSYVLNPGEIVNMQIIVIPVFYLLAMLFISYWLLLKRDIK